jgi:hypothetical protein
MCANGSRLLCSNLVATAVLLVFVVSVTYRPRTGLGDDLSHNAPFSVRRNVSYSYSLVKENSLPGKGAISAVSSGADVLFPDERGKIRDGATDFPTTVKSTAIASCRHWMCSCQGYSDTFGTYPSHWGSASRGDARSWWI